MRYSQVRRADRRPRGRAAESGHLERGAGAVSQLFRIPPMRGMQAAGVQHSSPCLSLHTHQIAGRGRSGTSDFMTMECDRSRVRASLGATFPHRKKIKTFLAPQPRYNVFFTVSEDDFLKILLREHNGFDIAKRSPRYMI